MRSFLCAAQDRFVRNEPRVATTTEIASSRMCPARDVGFVLIRNPESKPFNFNSPRFREVKDIFVAIVQKPLRIDWLEMTMRLKTAFSISNRDRLDPVNCVLQDKQVTQLDCNFMWQHRIRWRGPDVEKK